MRHSNAEWDFMARTFFVLSLGNMALRQPDRMGNYLKIMDVIIDVIIDETLRLEEENGHYYFLMDYARSGDFATRSGRSLFVDGEIALMLGARRLVLEKPEYGREMRRRVEIMDSQIRESPVLMGESYPNECWTFCNSAALAAIRMSDVLDGTDHSSLFQSWIDSVKKCLVHRESGILYSTYTVEGEVMEGPEGSSIWTVAHFLLLVDEEFALQQYHLAREQLGAITLGFGYAREWPDS